MRKSTSLYDGRGHYGHKDRKSIKNRSARRQRKLAKAEIKSESRLSFFIFSLLSRVGF
jgi:hypothetical protein